MNEEQIKKSSDILEKLGITLSIASIGDVIVGSGRLFLDILGILLGTALLLISVLILGAIKNDK
jgi:hypothetical protein